jgi:hypothetical protein
MRYLGQLNILLGRPRSWAPLGRRAARAAKKCCPNPALRRVRPSALNLGCPVYKSEVVMKNYFSIPDPMAFLNVTQEGGRVIKELAIMGFSLDPKECLDNAAGDLPMMGCSLFYKKVPGGGRSPC